MSVVNVLGCDPGKTGAVVLLRVRYGKPAVSAWWDMPLDGGEVDAKRLAADMRPMMSGVDAAVVEDVASRPGQGVAGVFSFGRSLGVLEGILGAFGVGVVLRPAPSLWKPSMGLSGGKDGKEASRALAVRLLPGNADLFDRAKDHDRAEAALLAWWGYLRLFRPAREVAPGTKGVAGGTAS